MEDFSSTYRQGNQNKDNRQTRHDGSTEHLVNGRVNDGGNLIAPARFSVFSDAIEHYDRIGQGIPRQRQQCRHD
jgi:hypothetical protein